MNILSTSLSYRFKKQLELRKMVSVKDHVLVSVSGGVDSMVLLRLMSNLRDNLKLKVSAIHFQHHLRSEAEKDADLVQKYCKELRIKFYRLDLDPAAKPKNKSFETWGREERYKHLTFMKKKIRADVVMTAHHSDDQIETVLMRIAEGSGLEGLQGIHRFKEKIVRPMLSFSKIEIEDFAEKNRVPFRTDKSNDDISHPRNFLRHHVIPHWKKQYPHLNSAIEHVTNNMVETKEMLNYVLEKMRVEFVEKTNNKLIIHSNRFDVEPTSLKVCLVKHLISNENYPWRRRHWKSVKDFIEHAQTGRILTIGQWELLKDRNQIVIHKNKKFSLQNYVVHEGDEIENESFSFSWHGLNQFYGLKKQQNTETFDAKKIGNELELRSWEDGDYIQPLGMSGHKKVSDFLTDIKMDRFSKKSQFVLANENEVLWICGQRISDKVKVTPETTQYAELSFQQFVG